MTLLQGLHSLLKFTEEAEAVAGTYVGQIVAALAEIVKGEEEGRLIVIVTSPKENDVKNSFVGLAIRIQH